MVDRSFFFPDPQLLAPLPPSLSLSFSPARLILNSTTQISLLVLLGLVIIVFLILKKQKREPKIFLIALFVTFLIWLPAMVLVRFYLSKQHLSQAQQLAQTNTGRETVNRLKKAVNFNPLKDNYRLSLAQASLSLANEKSQEENPDQQEVQNLIQESIKQGKIAVLLNPKKTENWLGLARIYAFLGPIPGAKDWALKCYQKAADLQPDNPRIRESIAALYYSQGKINEAAAELETALPLAKKDSKDFQRIKEELEKLNRQLLVPSGE